MWTRLRRCWPHARAAFFIYHVMAVVILSLPSAGALQNRSTWVTRNATADFEAWAGTLRRLGVETDGPRLRERLWGLAGEWAAIQRAIARPFAGYAATVGAEQGWMMFATPQRHPAELHVDLLVVNADGEEEWRPLFRPRSDEFVWMRWLFDHNRARKLMGRFARGMNRPVYDSVARFCGRRALAEFPGARAARVRLYRYATLPPAAVRAGAATRGEYEEERIFRAEEAR
jgi:hypothetical protein